MGMPAARLLTALVTLCWTVPDKHSGAAWPAARCRRALGVRAAVSAPEWPDALGRWLGRRPRRQGAHRADRKAELQTLLACNCIPAALLRVLRESSAVRAQTADCARQVLTAVGRRASFPEASGACGGPLAARGRGRDQGALSGPVPDTPAGRHRFPSCAARRAETFASELSGVGARPAGRRADAGAAGAGRQVRRLLLQQLYQGRPAAEDRHGAGAPARRLRVRKARQARTDGVMQPRSHARVAAGGAGPGRPVLSARGAIHTLFTGRLRCARGVLAALTPSGGAPGAGHLLAHRHLRAAARRGRVALCRQHAGAPQQAACTQLRVLNSL